MQSCETKAKRSKVLSPLNNGWLRPRGNTSTRSSRLRCAEETQDHCHQPAYWEFSWQSDRARICLHARRRQDHVARNPLMKPAQSRPATVFVMTISRLDFAHLPTPIEILPRFSEALTDYVCSSNATTKPGLPSAATRLENWNLSLRKHGTRAQRRLTVVAVKFIVARLPRRQRLDSDFNVSLY